STPYWMIGLSTIGSISLGWALVAGRKRVPRPAAGKTALRTLAGIFYSVGDGGWGLGKAAAQLVEEIQQEGDVDSTFRIVHIARLEKSSDALAVGRHVVVHAGAGRIDPRLTPKTGLAGQEGIAIDLIADCHDVAIGGLEKDLTRGSRPVGEHPIACRELPSPSRPRK